VVVLKELFLFSLNIISNIIFVRALSKDEASWILSEYAVSSGVSSAVVVFAFSQVCPATSRKGFILIMVFASAIYTLLEFNFCMTALYASTFIIVDYLSTQYYRKWRSQIRLGSFAMNIIYFYGEISYVIWARVSAGLVIILMYLLSKGEVKVLPLRRPSLVIVKSNLVYFGGLAFLANLVTNNLKEIYILHQVGFSLALKIYDFQLRFLSGGKKYVVRLMYFFGILPLVGIYLMSSNLLICGLYIVGYVSLIRLEKVL